MFPEPLHDEGDDINYDDSDVSTVLSWHSFPTSNYGSSEAGNSCTDDPEDLAFELAWWATEHNVSHVALRDLLKLLHTHFPNLPKDPRTLLSTKRSYEMKEITGGKYYHFGIAKGVSEKLRTENLSMDVQLIHLQINIDGLPLHKSSKTQFWPVLDRIIELEDSTPFIIGLFSGEQKPGNIEEYLHD